MQLVDFQRGVHEQRVAQLGRVLEYDVDHAPAVFGLVFARLANHDTRGVFQQVELGLLEPDFGLLEFEDGLPVGVYGLLVRLQGHESPVEEVFRSRQLLSLGLQAALALFELRQSLVQLQLAQTLFARQRLLRGPCCQAQQ